MAQKLPGLWGPRSAGLCPEPAEATPVGRFCRRGCVAAALGVVVRSVLEGRPDLVGRWMILQCTFWNCVICGLLLVLANVIFRWAISDSATVFP